MPFPDSGFFCKFSPDEPRMEYVSYSDEVITDNNVNSDAFVESHFSLLPSKYSAYHLIDCRNGIILLVSISVCATRQSSGVLQFPLSVMCLPLTLMNLHTTNLTITKTYFSLPCRSRRRLCRCLVQTNHRRLCRVTPPLVLAGRVPSSPLSQLGLYVAAGPLIIYQLKLDYHSKAGCFWILKYSICIHGLIDRHPNAERLYELSNLVMCKPYAIHPNLDIVFLGIPRMIFSYDLKTNKLELIWTRPFERPLMWGQYFFYTYSRCFIMLDDFSKRHHESSQLETIMEGTNGVELETVSDDRD
ncbi:hypothetical protein ACOSQ2_024024 [Xanthoceras sorbifolium]